MNKQETQLLLLLQDEIRHTRQLLELLELESTALVARDVTTLEKVAQDKLEQIRRLEACTQQRETLLTGIDGDPLSENRQLSTLWQDLLSVAAACQEKNRINGGVIEVSFRQSQQALDILHGVSSRAELYNQSGQTARQTKHNPLARA